MSDEDRALDDFIRECQNPRREWIEDWPTKDHPFEMIGEFNFSTITKSYEQRKREFEKC